jgi:biopolymer transport protein ExbD
MRFKRRLATDEEGIPITNLVDVLFLLIVFFMTSTVMSFDRGMDVKLPETKSAGQISRKGVTVIIQADGQVRVDGVPVRMERLGEAVKSRQAVNGNNVILQSDRTTQYQAIADVMDELLRVGINDISLPVLAKGSGG